MLQTAKSRAFDYSFSCSTQGTILLCLTSVIPRLTPPECTHPDQGCTSSTPVQLFVLYASLGFMALGASGVRPCCLAFAEDQIAHWDNARKDRALRGLFSWYYVSVGFSQIVAVTVLVYFQDKMGWTVGFMVPAAIMASATLLNLAVAPFYVKLKPQTGMWAGLLKVGCRGCQETVTLSCQRQIMVSSSTAYQVQHRWSHQKK